MPLVENFAPIIIMLRELYCGFQDRLSLRYGGIPNQSDAGISTVRISLVWRQF